MVLKLDINFVTFEKTCFIFCFLRTTILYCKKFPSCLDYAKQALTNLSKHALILMISKVRTPLILEKGSYVRLVRTSFFEINKTWNNLSKEHTFLKICEFLRKKQLAFASTLPFCGKYKIIKNSWNIDYNKLLIIYFYYKGIIELWCRNRKKVYTEKENVLF